jgi:hypothetical protein
MNSAVYSGIDVRLSRFTIFNDDNGAASLNMNSFGEGLEVQFERRSEDDGRSPEGLKGLVEPIHVTALSDDAEVIFHGQDLGGSSPKDCLIIGKDDLVHYRLLSLFDE